MHILGHLLSQLLLMPMALWLLQCPVGHGRAVDAVVFDMERLRHTLLRTILYYTILAAHDGRWLKKVEMVCFSSMHCALMMVVVEVPQFAYGRLLQKQQKHSLLLLQQHAFCRLLECQVGHGRAVVFDMERLRHVGHTLLRTILYYTILAAHDGR